MATRGPVELQPWSVRAQNSGTTEVISGETEAEGVGSLPKVTQPVRGRVPLQGAEEKWAEPLDFLAVA